MSDTMETSVSHRRIIPRTEDQVGQSAMDNLKAHLKKKVIIAHIMPGSASTVTKQTLVGVEDFKDISTESETYPYRSIIPFLAKNSAILRITAAGSGDVLYANTFLKAEGRDADIGYISKILSSDIDALRRLSFGCEVADRLMAEDNRAKTDLRK